MPRPLAKALQVSVKKNCKATRTTNTGINDGKWNGQMVEQFLIVPKPNDMMCLCLDPTRLNQWLIIPVHKRCNNYDIIPKLTNKHDGHHNRCKFRTPQYETW